MINRSCLSHAERIGAYRILNNNRYEVGELVSCLQSECAAAVGSRGHVLCIEDTSEFDYRRIKGRLSPDDPDVGKGTTDSLMHSFFLHPTLAVDADSGDILGCSSIQLFNREASLRKPKDRHTRPFEEKESYRWAFAAIDSARVLPDRVCKTMVCDREGDILKAMEGILDCGCDFLIRSYSERLELESGQRLGKLMASLPLAATFHMDVRPMPGRKGRKAQMELRFCPVKLASSKTDGIISAWCVLARECQNTVPDGEEPISWRLLTSHEVATVEMAIKCIEWYRKRWLIEEFFRVLKSKGFRMEDVQLGTGKAIKKLLVITMKAALKVMQMKQALDEQREDMEASAILGPEYVKVLEVYADSYAVAPSRNKGNTNPYKKGSLPWAAWIVARLGGWSGYEKSHGKPGRITLCEGFKILQVAVDFNIRSQRRDVYKE